MPESAVALLPIGDEDVSAVAAFLHEHLNRRVAIEAWTRLLDPAWGAGPNHGFRLVTEGRIVGAYAAVYARRRFGPDDVLVANLAAFCVLPEHRSHSLRLIRALLGQKGVEFTDLSPSGNVVGMNERLGFRRLDTGTRLVPNLPARPSRLRITADADAIGAALDGDDATIFRDHRDAPAARHVLVQDDDRCAYLMYRRVSRKRLPVFAAPLHRAGDADLLRSAWPQVAAHLLRRGFLLTLAERRVLGFVPGIGRDLRAPRPKMVKGPHLDEATTDYLYSELVLLDW